MTYTSTTTARRSSMESPSSLSHLTCCRYARTLLAPTHRASTVADTHTHTHTQVDGPHGAPAQDWSQFESAVLISAGLIHYPCRNSLHLSLRGVFVKRTHACMHNQYQLSGPACRYRSDAVRVYHQARYSPHEAMQNLTRRGRCGFSRSLSPPLPWTPLTSSVRRRSLSLVVFCI